MAKKQRTIDALAFALMLWATASIGQVTLQTQAASVEPGGLTLNDLLPVALARAEQIKQGLDTAGGNSWLAELPTVGLSYLDSEDVGGSSESELSVNFALKTPAQRKVDKSLLRLDEQHQVTTSTLRALQMSGFLRESAWSHRLASAKLALAQEKQQVLQQLLTRQTALAEARAIPGYGLLLLKQQSLRAEVEARDLAQQQQRWQQRFETLTGAPEPPAELAEPVLPAGAFTIVTHPAVQALSQAFEQQRLVARANSASAAPWTLSVLAKEVVEPGFSDRQLGLAVEMPLNFLSFSRPSERAERRRANSDYLYQRDTLYQQLQSRWQQLQSEAWALQRRETQLQELVSLTDGVQNQMQSLLASNELDIETVIRLTLDALETRAELSMNQHLRQRNNALLRQAAGIPL